MKYQLSLILLAAGSIGLAGCSAPGAQLKTGSKTVILHEGEAAELDLDKYVDIYPITPSLIREMGQGGGGMLRTGSRLPGQGSGADYRVGSGDVLQIIVWDHPELNPSVGITPLTASTATQMGVRALPSSNAGAGTVVDAQGNIFFPYAGKMRVAGMSAPQIQAMLTRRLARYIRSPQVGVNVLTYQAKRVNVGGAVKNPSQLAISNVPMRVLDAINLAGGFTDNADPTHVKITRNGVDHTVSLYDVMQRGDMSQNHLLGPNDVVFVPTNDQLKVHVMGEVKKQTTLKIPQGGMTLTDALGMAEGMNQEMADAKGVFVIRNAYHRQGDKIANVYQLNLKDASAFALGNRFKLQPNDVVFVTVAPIAKWNRVLNQVFPSIAVLGNLAAVFSAVK